jgi:NADH-quinone oxidoreductase subunit K
MLNFFYITLILVSLAISGLYLSRHHILQLLMSLEILLLSNICCMVNCSIFLDDSMGQVWTFYLLVIAASETAIGLALIVLYYKKYETFLLLSKLL